MTLREITAFYCENHTKHINTLTGQTDDILNGTAGGYMKSIIFWDMTPCSPLSFNRRFGGTHRLHLQGRRNKFSKPASKQVAFHVG
jgi:hypothetical protein